MRHATVVLAALGSLAAVLAGSAAAHAAPVATPTTTIGTDVSWPQCDSRTTTGLAPLPYAPAFAVVGVNDGVATTTNRCLAKELAWARGATGGMSAPTLSLYVNTANPGLQASWWPSSNTTKAGTTLKNPDGRCAHRAGAACAWVYGWSLAEQDLARLGSPAKAGTTWWLDVEAANTWSGERTANRAVLEGMTAGLARAGMRAGLYALRTDWAAIIGAVPTTSTLDRLPTWLAGAASHWGAEKACTGAPLTQGGRLAVAQYLPKGAAIDSDVACSVLHAPKETVTGTGRPGTWLTASGTWPSGTTLSYQWRRNGRTLAGAVHRSLSVHPADRGAWFSVRVTGTRPGFDRATAWSAARRLP